MEPHRKRKLVFVYVNDHKGTYLSDECAEWMEAFSDTLDSEVSPNNYENPYIGEMFEQIKESKITPDERAKMKKENNQEEAQQVAMEKGFKKGREEGLEKGREETRQKQENTARNLLALGALSVEQIASATGLTVEKVKAL